MDGFCAAWIASKFLPSDTDFIAVNYYEPLPENLHENVLIVDFSYSRGVLEYLRARTNNLIVLDHHKTAKENLDGLEYCHFDMNKSGAMLTWEFFSSDPPPWIVEYVQDADLWKWKLESSKEVSIFLSSQHKDFDTFNDISQFLPDAITAGRSMSEYKDSLINFVLTNAHKIAVGLHEVWAVNSPIFQSEVGHELATRGLFGVVYCQLNNGRWKYSIRVDDDVDFDAAEFAALWGGGGHEKAASFITDDMAHRSL